MSTKRKEKDSLLDRLGVKLKNLPIRAEFVFDNGYTDTAFIKVTRTDVVSYGTGRIYDIRRSGWANKRVLRCDVTYQVDIKG